MTAKRKPLSAEHRANLAESLRRYNASEKVRAQRSEEQRRRFADPAEREAAAERMRQVMARHRRAESLLTAWEAHEAAKADRDGTA